MPSLLEKKPVRKAALSTLPLQGLRARYRWERWRGVLFSLVVGLTTTLVALWAFHPSWQKPNNGEPLADIWVGGLLFTALGGALARRLAPLSWISVAEEMDRKLLSKNRIEASVILYDSATPLAEAQLKETAVYLNRVSAKIRPGWIFPWLVASTLVLIIAHLLTFAIWVIPIFPHAAAGISPSPQELALPKASIIWKSPEAESKANPIEEIPAVAITQSTTGLENLSLEISVNGTLKKSISLSAKPFYQPGQNILKTSLFMDELEVTPFDVVSYFIRARRITEQKVPDTTSPLQFIQVRPFRDDVAHEPDAKSTQNFNLLLELKLAQLQSVKENFILAHTELTVTNSARVMENNRVGKNQAQLSAKTEEIVEAFIEAGYSADMIDLLRQAEPAMDDASKKIFATQNSQALSSQEKALNLIVEVEKFFQKVMPDQSKGSQNVFPDPFKDKQQHELKKRSELAAGQLEELFKNEAQVAHDLSSPESPSPADSVATDTADPTTPTAKPRQTKGDPLETKPSGNPQSVDPFGPDANKGTLVERQTRVVQGIDILLNTNKVLSPLVNQALRDAQNEASESMRQLDLGDEAEAREPAAIAAQDLQKAILRMNKEGEEIAKEAMAEGQQQLNDLAGQIRHLAQEESPNTPHALENLARQVRDTQEQLEEAANRQQAAGSSEDAQRLQRLAQAISDQKVGSDLANMSKTGLDRNKAEAVAQKLEALAGQAAQGTASTKPSTQDIARLIDSLEKSRANLARLAQLSGGLEPDPADQGKTSQGQGPASEKTGAQGKDSSNAPDPAKDGKSSPDSEQPAATDSRTSASVWSNGVKADGGAPITGVGQAYQEVVADLRDETERTEVTVPPTNVGPLMAALASVDAGTPGLPAANGAIVHAYGVISRPLDALIANLVEQSIHVQRQEVVKQPDLDEAPAAYRSAVSKYFETMSQNYHPGKDDEDTLKP